MTNEDSMPTFTYDDNAFLLDGQPVRILSGAIHYFRVAPESWRDRLQKLKAFGCNTVETYLAWNLHEETEGRYDFSGPLDVARFVALAQELGLWVIVRPGPYICAEWEMGGLPAWLLADSRTKFRCSDPTFLRHAKRFLGAAFERLEPLMITRGGPIIMVQVENEYGAFGNDTEYLQSLAAFTRERVDVTLFTSDQPTPKMLLAGSTKGVLATANFGSRAKSRLEEFGRIFPKGPRMCAEFWCGWFDHWGGVHHTRSARDAAAALDEILSEGASVNFYMFHGGTNFGFMNGANCRGERRYQPTVTSYDYDALLSECGDLTEKYFECRKVMEKHFSLPPLNIAHSSPKLPPTGIRFTKSASLLASANTLGSTHRAPTPLTMEQCRQNTGFILYRTTVSGPIRNEKLVLAGVRDRAQIFVDGVPTGTVYRNDKRNFVSISAPGREVRIEVLVENMGRVNYGPHLADAKGIVGGLTLNEQSLFNWETITLPMTNLETIVWTDVVESTTPQLFRAEFTIDAPADTFLALPGWSKGVCFVNGHNLGRYWNIGPQETLYLPAPFLHKGTNELIVLELHPERHSATKTEIESGRTARLLPSPLLGRGGKIREILATAKQLL
jgi:beta-galactosidase